MAKSYNPKDAYALMNALVHQATGQSNLAVVDTSTFISAGETVLSTGVENVLNSLGIVLGRTLMAVRPYNARLTLMNSLNTDMYTNRLRKISFYSKDAVPAGAFNTQLFTNLADGFTAGQNPDGEGEAQSTKSQWEQHQPIALEMNFGGQDVWQDAITIYEDQLKVAFRSETEFMDFVSGYMQEKANDIESQKEAFNRAILLNKIASVYDMDLQGKTPGSVINLTSAYNQKFGTQYTSAELRTTYLKEFLAFFVSEFKLASKYMTERSANYHWSPEKEVNGVDYTLLRHTPYDKQRVYLYSPLFTEAEALVLPEIFRPEFLDIKKQYEEVTFWQSQQDRAGINVIPGVINPNTGVQGAGTPVSLDYVVGMICDVDGMMTDFQLEDALSTPVEARKRYRNMWWTFSKNGIVDPTENCIIFTMEDE